MEPAPNGEEASDSLNYFICTLGQAASINGISPHKFKTINEFIDVQAERVPGLPAVAFPIPQDKDQIWSSVVLTFEELRSLSVATAQYLEKTVLSRPNNESPKCVALLCPSTIDFLVAWLALMRIGYGVLLIAPQCQPAAIAHLCNSSDASILLFDKSYSKLASSSTSSSQQYNKELITAQLPWQEHKEDILSLLKSAPRRQYKPFRTITEHDTAYIHHTSGTSTGLPKPIPQTHRAGVGVLPCLNGSEFATFTTTPLYHGGIADCFRAWTSNGLIWLFPGGDVPITTDTILKSLNSASDANKRGCPAVQYFSSVPYVLQMLSEDNKGVEKLCSMEIVGVGGAALPASTGDALVTRGVNLVSRFGSAECGFLLSSHRAYAKDTEWQYLRPPEDSKFLSFDPQPSSLYELVVLGGWPHMAKTNREDGGFATADLFEPHEVIPGAWKYHSRKDAQLTLVTGKKFDPQPLEAAVTASSSLIGDCLVFGSGRMVPGALIFRAEGNDMEEDEFVDRVWRELVKINAQGQDHTRIGKDMIVVLPRGAELAKSSKGTVLRGEAEKKFAKEIEGAYSGIEGAENGVVNDEDVLPLIRDIVMSVTGGKALGDYDDFYHCGVDSAKCTQIRALIQKKVFTAAHTLPFNVVYDCGTISRLVEFVNQLRHDDTMPQNDGYQEMIDLANKFSSPLPLPDTLLRGAIQKPSKHTVLLTGATGALGAHILHSLNILPGISQVYCLVRSSSAENALSRVNESLSARRKPTISPSDDKIICLPSKIGKEYLGLSEKHFVDLAGKVTLIIHAAWPVNFSLPLRTFTSHFYGLQTLLSLTNTPLSPRLLFCSSTASVLRSTSPISETVSNTSADSDLLGYSRSKWVAEQICHRYSGGPGGVSICRIGQLTGDTQHGAWNMSEAYPRLLSTVEDLGCLPELKGEVLCWLPLDIAAKSVVELGLEDESRRVYHIVNNDRSATWAKLLHWLGEIIEFEVVEPNLWLQRLEALDSHPAKGLVGLWKKAYCGDDVGGGVVVFETKQTEEFAPALKGVEAVDEILFEKIWRWLQGELRSTKRPAVQQ